LKNFVSYSNKFILDALLNFEPVKRFKNWSDVSKFGSFRLRQLELRNLERVGDDRVDIEKGQERGSCSNKVWSE